MFTGFSLEYSSFRASIPQKKISIRNRQGDCLDWTIYDAGPRNITSPIVFIPPISANGDVFFRQMLSMSSLGYRVIAVNYPLVRCLRDWFIAFSSLLDHLQVNTVHLFGAGAGGLLAQKYAEVTASLSSRVASIILCNTFVNVEAVRETHPSTISSWFLPTSMLKKSILSNKDAQQSAEDKIISTTHSFVAKQCESLTTSEIMCRLQLINDAHMLENSSLLFETPITIIEVCDYNGISIKDRDNLHKYFPQAKLAYMKTGGEFPYLSRPEEINLFCRIHCKPFILTAIDKCKPCRESFTPYFPKRIDLQYSEFEIFH